MTRSERDDLEVSCGLARRRRRRLKLTFQRTDLLPSSSHVLLVVHLGLMLLHHLLLMKSCLHRLDLLILLEFVEGPLIGERVSSIWNAERLMVLRVRLDEGLLLLLLLVLLELVGESLFDDRERVDRVILLLVILVDEMVELIVWEVEIEVTVVDSS